MVFGAIPQAIIGNGLPEAIIRGILIAIVCFLLTKILRHGKTKWWYLPLYMHLIINAYMSYRNSIFSAIGPDFTICAAFICDHLVYELDFLDIYKCVKQTPNFYPINEQKKKNPLLFCIVLPSMKGGGAEKQLCKLVTALKTLPGRITCLLTGKGVNYQALESSGTTIHLLRVKSNYSLDISRQINDIIDQIKPDIVEVWLSPMYFFWWYLCH